MQGRAVCSQKCRRIANAFSLHVFGAAAGVVRMQTAILMVMMVRILPVQNRMARTGGPICISLCSQRASCQRSGLPEH